METIELSGRTGQEVCEELKHWLEDMGYLPDEYFPLDADREDRRVTPRNADLFCATDYEDSEGTYLNVYLKWYGEDGRPVIRSFAIGRTLGESGSDMDRMFLISSAIAKAFHGEQGAYTRYRQMEDSTKAEDMVPHLGPKEQRVLMGALLEQRMQQEAQMTSTGQFLRRMTGNITAYMGEVDARPLRMSTADRVVLAIQDGELYVFSSLTVQITKPEERGSLLAAVADGPDPMDKQMARLMFGAKSSYPEDVWLDTCKRAVDTGDLQQVQMMLGQTMDKVANPSPALPGKMLRYAFGQNRAMTRELIRWATLEQVTTAPFRPLCGTAYAHDLPILMKLPQKGLQPGDQAAPPLRSLLAAYGEQRVVHLLRDSLQVQPEDYEAMNVYLQAQAQVAAEALLERGMRLGGYLAWATEQDVLLGTQAQEILDYLAERQAQVDNVPEQNGSVLRGMSL